MTASGLTARQREVLVSVVNGLTNKEIADALGVSEQAIKMHVSALLRHFSVSTRTSLVRIAIGEALVQLSRLESTDVVLDENTASSSAASL